MDNQNQHLHEVAITAIVVKGGGSTGSPEPKYLITRRSLNKKRFPGMWTVPGGKMETSDYLQLPKDTEHYWYNVLERTLRREVKEEVGIDIENIEYVTSLATVHTDGSPSLVISCMADYAGGDIRLKVDESDQYAWASLEEAKNYQLIDGIYDELVMVENKRNGKRSAWQRFR
ncbi:MAG: NUDIX domain-containing protein [Candidatus Liptonbacteria bacterium]|nr:NUDIX domain-containing protein [Candidatus Liptonbacteria bacterium]